MLGTVCGAIISGQLVARTGRYRMNALVGPVVLAVGMVLLWHMNVNTSTIAVARNMVIGGLGLGLMNQVFVVAAQNSVPNGVLGTVTGLLQFSRAMGTAIGVTVFGTIITQRLPPGILAHGQVVHNLSVGDRATLASVFHPAFLVATTAAVLILVVVFFGLKERPLRWTVGDAAAAEPGGRPVPGPNGSERSLLEMEP
jgi:MFS family permease